MTENKRIFWNVIATYGRSVYAMAVGLFTSRWVLGALGEVDYGLMGVVGGLTGFIVFLNSLMAESIVRFYAYSVGAAKVAETPEKGLEDCRRWFSIALAIHTVLPLILVIIGYPVGIWAVRNWLVIPPDRIDACVWVWRFVCASCFVGMVSVPFNAMYTAKQEIAELTIYGFVCTTILFGLTFYMTLSQRDWLAWYSGWTCAIAVAPRIIIAARAVIKYPECRFRLRFLADWTCFLELFKYSGVRFFGALSQLVTAQGLALLVNKLLGPARNAAMAIGTNLSSKTMTLTMSFRGALQPAITNATGAGDDRKANSLSIRTCVISTLGVLFFAIPLFVEVDEVMILWLKNPPTGAGLLCRILLVSTFIDQLTIGHVMRIFATGKITRFQVLEAIVWLSALVVAWAWIAGGGDIEGVGIGYVVMFSLDNVVKLYCARTAGGIGLSIWFRRVLIPVSIVTLVTGILGVIPSLFMPQSLTRVLVTGIACEVVFVPLVWLFALTAEDRALILAKVRRLRGAK